MKVKSQKVEQHKREIYKLNVLRFWVEGDNVLLGEKYKLNAEKFSKFYD